jgi:hypothetical protein
MRSLKHMLVLTFAAVAVGGCEAGNSPPPQEAAGADAIQPVALKRVGASSKKKKEPGLDRAPKPSRKPRSDL